jgi:iron complex transport system substrate-binding protein
MTVPRIVSLVSSATEIVHALGRIEWLVGRSHECDYPASILNLPVCTRPRIPIDAPSAEIDRLVRESARTSISIYEVFDSVIDALAPTHILTQVQCEVCAVSLADVEAAVARGIQGNPRVVSLQPDSLASIWSDIKRVAAALEIPEAGDSAVGRLQSRMQALRRDSTAGPTVACIEWIEPLMAAGNWTPELIDMAGGRNLFGEPGKHSPWMTWEQLAGSDPDVILIAPCGFDIRRTRQELSPLIRREGWNDLRAVRAGRVYVADGNQYFNRPGPRVVETLEILDEILYPERETFRHRGAGWQSVMMNV